MNSYRLHLGWRSQRHYSGHECEFDQILSAFLGVNHLQSFSKPSLPVPQSFLRAQD
jgi:hypothetical protein